MGFILGASTFSEKDERSIVHHQALAGEYSCSASIEAKPQIGGT